MRKIVSLNDGWSFSKNASGPVHSQPCDTVNLPHTWYAADGADGGNDYYRGACLYTKRITKDLLPDRDRYFVEVRGANSSADLYVNGNHLYHHDGGYSTWRVDVTDSLTDESELAIVVDNSPNETVYPQMADFTFYGGLYRSVNLICVNETHLDLEYYGGTGLMITPIMRGKDADVEITVYPKNMREGDRLVYTVFDSDGNELLTETTADATAHLTLVGVRRWHGRKDPYLYRCEVRIERDGQTLDTVSSSFGCRSFEIDPERGFILNGEEYPLRGVSRHQDRWGVGNALLPEHHEEDIGYIMEVGATTVRLAHYQHDQYFYDLCDEKGLVIWAEIPYISRHMPSGRENTVSQLTELIIQNYNHPSIVVWGLSNEITISGSDDDLLENHRILNDLAHELDKTRLTAVAAVSMCDVNDPYLKIPDVVSYNHYFGWYGGDTSMNGPWFDKFHATHPTIPIGCSEYGCEALNWHTSGPKQGDYTEEYQAYYHEELIKQLFTRKYLWATHVWNMFDFGADARAEGGENGQNHKGLMTMDRGYKKDSFYAYKAWLSDEPFVHLCGKRYIDRVENVTRVTVYSNLPEVELLVNGHSLGTKRAPDHFFHFDVPNEGESIITALAGEYTDEGRIRKVDEMNPDYILVEAGAVLNWFDIENREGFFSLNDKLGDILETPRGRAWFEGLGRVIKEKTDAAKKDGTGSGGFEIDPSSGGVMEMMSGFTVLRLCTMMAMMNVSFTKEELLGFNKELNLIEKPTK